MKRNAWTIGLIGAGLVGLPSVLQAEESASAVLSALSATTLSGYVDTSAQWNLGTGNQFTPAYSFGGSSKADGFNLNVAKVALEKPIDANDAWGAGYKVELLAGPDANAIGTQSLGVKGDFAIKQAYVALHAPVGNGLDFKVGVWDAIIGYEVFDAPSNPNFTRSYGITIEPFTHTGVQAAYKFTDFVSATIGVANTFGAAINERAFPTRAESYKTYMGVLTFTAPESWGFLAGSTLSGGAVNGFNSGVAADETSWYVGTTLNTPINGFKVGAAYDYLGVSEQAISGSGYANAVALYASYQLTEKMTIFGRGEYASSSLAGGRLLGAPEVVATTATLQYDIWKNVLSRLEFRWDHAASGGPAYGGVNAGDAATRKNSYILLANIAYKF